MLHEGERHTFYSDEDGFFALTIDPVRVEDTGRYTCMATNEYGQASTSAFFKVLKGNFSMFDYHQFTFQQKVSIIRNIKSLL